MSTENHSYFTCSDCPFRPSYLFLPVTWLFVHSFAWWILHYTYLIPSTPWMTSAYSLLYNPPHPQHATINGSPSSFVCFSQLCIIVFSVLIAKSRPLLPTPWMITIIHCYDHHHHFHAHLYRIACLVRMILSTHSSLLTSCLLVSPPTHALNPVNDFHSFTTVPSPTYFTHAPTILRVCIFFHAESSLTVLRLSRCTQHRE